MNKTKIRGKFLITIFSCLMIISIAYGLSLEDLTDHTIYDNQSNICTASNLGMNIDVYPCNVQDIDGKNIQQNVDFKWEGVSPQDTSWVFVYDGEIESGKIEVETNQSYEVQEYENTWITNYTLNNVNNTDDLTPNYTINETFILPNGICDLGNENNTQIFNVTYDEISTENGTIQESELVCFTSNIGYSISGNYDKLVNNTKYRNIWTDQTNKISFMGNNLLGDGMSFYKVQNITFQPNQTIKTKWTYTPKDKAETGKWSILGYPSSLSIQDAINQELYIFLDPWWNSSWSYYKQYTNLTGNITYLEINRTLNDNADWNDTRFISCDNSTELNFTLEAEIGTYGQFRVNNLGQSCFYRYYGNAGATSTSSASNTYFNPVSAYYFDANANDFVGSNDATIHGTTSLENGYINRSYLLDTTSDFIDMGDIMDTSVYTTSFWIYPNAITNNYVIIRKNVAGASGFRVLEVTGGIIRYEIQEGSNEYTLDTPSSSLVTGAWQMITILRRSNNSAEIYVNAVGKSYNGATTYATNNENLEFGDGRGLNINAKYDEILIYNKALTQSEIEALYNQTAPNFIEGAEQTETTTLNVSNIIWSTTGGFTDNTLLYGQTIDWINATCSSDSSLSGCNITIKDPDNISNVDNIAMTNVSSNFTYTSDILLNKVGTWIINITAIDSDGSTNSTTSSITVSIQSQSTKDGWYGYSNASILTQSEITSLSAYGYDIFELEENMTNVQNNFTAIQNSINNSRNSNIKSGLNILLDFDYNSTALTTQYLADITENFSLLNTVPYSDSVVYISFELVSQSNFNDTIKYTLLNNMAEEVVSTTSNEFIVYSKNYNNSNLDSSYISYTDMLYFNPSTESAFIEDQKIAFKNNASLNRIYESVPDTVKVLTQDFHSRIIDNLRSVPNPNNLSNENASNLNNKDVLIFNNGSSARNFTIDVSVLSVLGKDVWDSTNGVYIENNTDQTITVEVSGYNASILYFEDLDHIQLDTNTNGVLYKGGSSSTTYSNHTDAVLDGNFGMAGAYDIQIELYDKHYTQANFITYYGWLNVTSLDLSNYDVVILADQNNDELDALNYTPTEFYGYISVADYNNTEGWTTAKKVEVDDWLALNDSLHIFVDGMDSGVGGTNFSSRMKNLIDYVQIDKGRKGILNTYTAYADFATWGTGGVMKESCVNRWNGASASTPDNYSRENWTLELERSEWFTAHGVDVLCQAFDNRSNDGTFTIENYTELQNIYFASKVLGYDYFYLSQPDFQYTHEEWVYNVGASLGRNAQQLSTDPNTYYRAYENGIVYYNTTSEQGWIEDGLVINDVQTCFYLYNPYATTPEWRFNINSRDPTGSTGEYSLTQDWSVGTWAWKCVDTSNETPINGRYLIEAWVGDHTTIVGQGYNLGWSAYAGSGTHSWYDTSTTDSFTAYPEDRNWMINMSVNITKKISIDTTSKITQSEANGTGVRNITVSSATSFPIEIWSKSTVFSNFGNVSFLNSSGSWVNLNYQNNTDCDSNNPTWGTTSIEGATYKACIENSGSDTLIRVATPSLSIKVFQITTSDTTSPEISLIYPTNTTYLIPPTELNFSASDDNLDSCWYSLNDSVNFSTSCSANITSLTATEGINVWTVYANDTLGNENESSVTFTLTDTADPVITITNPVAGEDENTNPISLSITINEISTCNYSIDSSENRSMGSGTSLSSDEVLLDGLHFVEFFCSDTEGNEGNNSLYFNVHLVKGGGSSGSGSSTSPKIVSGVKTTLYEIEVLPEKWYKDFENKVLILAKDTEGNLTEVDEIKLEVLDIDFTEETLRIGIGEYESRIFLLEPVEKITLNVTIKQGLKTISKLEEIEIIEPSKIQKTIKNIEKLAEDRFRFIKENKIEVGLSILIILFAISMVYLLPDK